MIEFDPLISLPLIGLLTVLAAVLTALSFWKRVRGSLFRTIALAAFCLALANPVLVNEERVPLDSVVAVIVDRSQSQATPERRSMTDAALERLTRQLSRFPRLDVRVVETGEQEFSDSPSTRLFESLAATLQDVPTSRVAGAVMITDGQIHDVPD